MWKLYAPTGSGIAIQTSIPKFKQAFEVAARDVFAGKVIYIDYDTDPFYATEDGGYSVANALVAFIHKRKMFEHEKEYRAVVPKTPDEPQGVGLEVDVDLEMLVNRVIIAPKTPDWILNAVSLLVGDHLKGIEVGRSIGDLDPPI